MKCIDRYIFAEFSKKFTLFFITLNVFLFCADTYKYLENFLKHRVSLGDMFYHYMTQGIVYLPLILPLTFVMTLIFIFVAMQRRNEIIALLSSGINFFKITRVFWLCGFVGSAILLWGNFEWIAKAREYSNHHLERLEVNGDALFVKHLTFNTSNRLWYINRYNKVEGRAFEIAIHEYDAREKECRRIVAQLGSFDEKINAWTLERGREILFHPKKQIAEKVYVFERRVFFELRDSPKLMSLFQMPLQNLSLSQLQAVIKVQGEMGGIYKMRFWDLILSSSFCFLSCWIVLPVLFSTFGRNHWRGVMRLGVILSVYGTLSYTLYALGASGTVYWLYVPLAPFCFLVLMPLLWIRKLC
ncbi:MAG: LptF/LptG family permease [Puniceicoccales bacterium]|nr:LptF/LptG family permease [Puniceicoccales bacterium]